MDKKEFNISLNIESKSRKKDDKDLFDFSSKEQMMIKNVF